MTRCVLRASVLLAVVCLVSLPAAAQSPANPKSPPNELDAFMEKVLKRREINRQVLEQYVLDEHEQFEVLGPSRMPIYRQKREFTWYVRDGLHVRSPVRFDGVTVGDAARKVYEDNWSKGERGRLERQRKKEQEKTGDGKDAPKGEVELPIDDPAGPAGASPIPTPRFVSESYFMDFKFEPGSYYLAGREQLEGKNVLRIEYYPTRLFDGDDNERERKQRERQSERSKREAQRIERQMNKTARVTIWVDPAEHQIVKYTFENVWMDFLPAKWLVRVDDIKASMTMGQPFPDVWLPREMNIHAGVTIAAGPLEAAYERRFANYKLAETKTIIRIPKHESPDEPEEIFFPEPDQTPAPAPATEVVAHIRVHGNAWLRDDEVVRLAGVSVGQPLASDGVQQIQQRLERSGYFETVEILKRYRSLEVGGPVSLVLVVHERPGQTSETAGAGPSASPWKRLKSQLMFLPIVDYHDGYGFTYGGRLSTVDLFGAGERVSTPFTWGGTRRAAVEVERTFKRGPLTRVQTTFGIAQRENPRFEIDDRRVSWTARAERSFAGLVRAGVETSHAAASTWRHSTIACGRSAPTSRSTRAAILPFRATRCCVGTSWTALHVRGGGAASASIATPPMRAAISASSVRPCWLGGCSTRPPIARCRPTSGCCSAAHRTCAASPPALTTAIGCSATSAELRVPITSVLNGAKLGVHGVRRCRKDVRRRPARRRRRLAPRRRRRRLPDRHIVRLNLDVAHGLNDGKTRVHLGIGLHFLKQGAKVPVPGCEGARVHGARVLGCDGARGDGTFAP